MTTEFSTKIKSSEESLQAVAASLRRCTIGRTVARGAIRGFFNMESAASAELVSLAINEFKNSAGQLKENVRVFARAVDELSVHVEKETASTQRENGSNGKEAKNGQASVAISS